MHSILILRRTEHEAFLGQATATSSTTMEITDREGQLHTPSCSREDHCVLRGGYASWLSAYI